MVRYLSNKLKESFSDLIFSCSLKEDILKKNKIKQGQIATKEKTKKKKSKKKKAKSEGKGELKIALLFEHKSNIIQHPFLQLLRYIVEGTQFYWDTEKELRLIIPIVFFHGEKDWVYRPVSDYYKDYPDILKRFLPTFEYILSDISSLSNEEILDMNYSLLRNILLAFKNSHNIDFIKENFELFFIYDPNDFESQEELENFFTQLLVYLINITELSAEEFIDITKKLSKPIKQHTMTTYQNIFDKGEKSGFDKGLEISILNAFDEGIKIRLIAKIVDKPESYVLEVLKKHGRIKD